MSKPLDDDALDQIFRKARTHSAWLDQPVTDESIQKVYDLMKWGPTSANSCPLASSLFVRSKRRRDLDRRCRRETSIRQ